MPELQKLFQSGSQYVHLKRGGYATSLAVCVCMCVCVSVCVCIAVEVEWESVWGREKEKGERTREGMCVCGLRSN